jgi:hypothetical protein
MASDAQLVKRDKYLIEGRVEVVTHSTDPPFAHLLVRGSGSEPYEVWFRANGWTCSCPAQVLECVHILVAKLISPLRPSVGGHTGLNTNPDIDALLNGPVVSAFADNDDEWEPIPDDEDKEW